MADSIEQQIADAIAPLTFMQRLYVASITKGMSKVASATAAGQANPKKNYYKLDQAKGVQAALKTIREITAGDMHFGMREAHEMYMEAFHAAATSMEMTKATDSLVKLHGLAAPEKKSLDLNVRGRVDHSHSQEDVKELPDHQLMRLAQLDSGQAPFTIEGEAIPVTVQDEPDDAED